VTVWVDESGRSDSCGPLRKSRASPRDLLASFWDANWNSTAIARMFDGRSGGIRSWCFWPERMQSLNAATGDASTEEQIVGLDVLDSTAVAPAQPDRVPRSTDAAPCDVQQPETMAGQILCDASAWHVPRRRCYESYAKYPTLGRWWQQSDSAPGFAQVVTATRNIGRDIRDQCLSSARTRAPCTLPTALPEHL
jgi:hypothetical protein